MSAQSATRPASVRDVTRHAWAPLVVLVGLILVAVGLVLALDCDDGSHQGAVVDADEGDAHSALMSGQGLDGPQKKLMGWLKQMRNASELYVEAGSTNMILSGVLLPRNDSKALLPFDAIVAIDSSVAVPSREYVVLANGKGYKWVVTSLGYGDSIETDGCLTTGYTQPFFATLNSILPSTNWTSSDSVDESAVNVEFNGDTFTVSKEVNNYELTEHTGCWSIESEDEDFGSRVCVPEFQESPPKAGFTELFSSVIGCPQLVPNSTRVRTHMNVPLPLRKWYASYKA
ncbi:unnamed protein product [Phytophthora lilii]|uniref:Unnamed protein product n=1 Tax=Phytophthora lilii TaxID=2077276 RepID=A0A9W6TAI8_9STRA|nr:unnamed protein product [Phytophthora lilii]